MLNRDYDLEVGQRIRAARESMHMSREKFGRLCDISPSFLAAVESGKKGITSKTVYKICSAAHLSANYIVSGKKSEKNEGILPELIGELSDREREHVLQMISVYVRSVQELSDEY